MALAIVRVIENKVTVVAAGLRGPTGAQGEQGETGISAYDLAVDNGYTGTVEDWLALETSIAGAVEEIEVVAANIANITTVAGMEADITAVLAVEANIATVAGIADEVSDVALVAASIPTVAGIAGDIGTVAGIAGNVTTVATIATNVVTIAGMASAVNAVAAIDDEVAAVAAISADITTAAANIEAIQAAPDIALAVEAIAAAGNIFVSNAAMVAAVASIDEDAFALVLVDEEEGDVPQIYQKQSGTMTLVPVNWGDNAVSWGDISGTLADQTDLKAALDTKLAASLVSVFGGNLIGAADAAAARAVLNLVIGTNVQAQNANLAALAGLTSAANKLPYFTGSGSTAVADFTSFGRTLAALANAAALRDAAGLGNTATFDEASAANLQAGTADKVVTTDVAWSAASPVTITYSSSLALNFNSFINGKITLTGNITFANPSNVKPGQSGIVEVIQDGTGSRIATWGSNYVFAGGTDLVLSTTASARDLIAYQVLADSKVFVSLIKDVKN